MDKIKTNCPKRILITGIAGFIGFHLASFLNKRGDFVVGCDNFNDYYDPLLKKLRAEQLQLNGIAIQFMDICNQNELELLLSKNQITHVVHLAAQAGVRYSLQHPEKYLHSNLNGFLQILEVLKKFPKIKLTYASSSSVYGLNDKIPFAETDPTTKPANFYAASKIANEAMAHAYHHLYGISTTGLRFFTVYGPWGRPDMAYFSFARAIMNGEPIQLFNQGKMKRDFTYIDDIIKGTAAAIDLQAPCEIFNLGNNRPEELMHLIEILEKKLQKIAIKKFLPMQPGETSITYADISKSQKLLGFVPSTSLEQGLEHFINWYRSFISQDERKKTILTTTDS